MLSVIVTWRDRDELERAIPSMLCVAQSLCGEVLVVNFGGDLSRLRRQLPQNSGLIKIVHVPDRTFFNKPAAANMGASQASKDLLFFCDCDIVLGPDLFLSLSREVASTPDVFATLAGVRETETNSRGAKFVTRFGYELRIRTRADREVRILDHEEDASDGTRQAPGLLMVKATDFKCINGYNSGLDGWGWEDQDMICRLTLGAGLRRIQQGVATHISHDDHARVGSYPYVDRWESRDRMFRRALANYDRAHFLGTFTEDVHVLRGAFCVEEC